MSYTLAEMEQITGAKRRALQFWSDAGVIQPETDTDRAGRGVHRRYSRHEAMIACVIRPFAEMHLPIGELHGMAAGIRNGLNNRKDARLRDEMKLAITGDVLLFLYFLRAEGGWLWEISAGESKDIDEVKLTPRDVQVLLGHLQAPDSSSHVILLNTYLSGLRGR
jgi:DNA-binding transcriptional MerR regulator